MGIEFGSKEKESISDNISLSRVKTIGYFDEMIRYADVAMTHYKQGFPTKSVTDINNLIWYAEVIRERIKKE